VYHPLLDNLDQKSMDELMQMTNDLSKKMSFAYNSGNYQLLEQIRVVYNTVQDTIQQKNRQQMEMLQRKQESKNTPDNLDIE